MDKLKIVLDFFKKYSFWFLISSTVIVVLICWWMATGSLATQFQQQQTQIQNKFSSVEAIVSDTQHPTPESIKTINDKHTKLKEGVLAVWSTLYNEQKQKNPWPEMLGKEFIDTVNKLGPTDQIPDYLREKYQNRIKEYFPELFKIVDMRRPAEGAEDNPGNVPEVRRPISRILPSFRSGTPLTSRTDTGDNAGWVGVVYWNGANQQELKDRFEWPRTPSSLAIRLAQEDLWVYETLFRVISETNEGATDQSQANVKQIEWIHIGADAIKAWSDAEHRVFRPLAQEGGLVQPTTAAPGANQESSELLKDRYVNDKGTALAADAPHPYAEFKMMPISMKLHMDQRKIAKLLVECVNRSMPIEVRRVRIRPGEGEILDTGTQGAGIQTSHGRDDGYRRAPGGIPVGPSRTNLSPDLGGTGETGLYDIAVEIQGIIYIYNPPNLNTLGTGTAAEKPAEPAPGATPGAQGGAGAPAATPATLNK